MLKSSLLNGTLFGFFGEEGSCCCDDNGDYKRVFTEEGRTIEIKTVVR